MRLFIPRLLLGLAAAAPVFAQLNDAQPADLERDVLKDTLGPVPAKGPAPAPPVVAAAAPAADSKSDPKPAVKVDAKSDVKSETKSTKDPQEPPRDTVFNGVTVPPMKQLRGETFSTAIKDGYWFVKYFSPYCTHCKMFAPTWQTLYEFYYTSKPLPATGSESTTSLNSFQGYYNFHFNEVDCIVWGDLCADQNVDTYPTLVLFKDGKEVERFTGAKDMTSLSHFVEETLETIKPGSRPAAGVKVPMPGDTSVDTKSAPNAPLAKDKNAAAGAAAGEKHNEIASSDATVSESTGAGTGSTVKVSTITPTKPTTTPNPAGTSIPLTAESFQKLVTQTKDPWFIKFYAPWCHHCQALAPNWHQMARELQGQLNIGEVNCDVERRLCKDAGVRAYPTIHFFRGGERVEYLGLRGLGDLISYAKKAVDVGMGVKNVDAAEFKKMEETEEVIFLYFFDDATTTEDFEALEHLTLSLVGHAKLVKTDSAVLADRFKIHTWPRLIVSRDGRPSYYNALAPKEMRDFRQVLTWMKSVWLPIVPELTASNSHEIMDGRYVVLGILSRERPDEFTLDKRELKNAAMEWMDREVQAFKLERQELRDSKQLRIEEAEDRDDERALRDAKHMRIHITEQDRKQVGFAWVDGVFWERWLRTTYGVDVRDSERVIINDEDNRRYWDQTITGAPIIPSRSYILETLQKITSDPPKITPKYTTGIIHQVFHQTKVASQNHPYFAVVVFVAAIIAVAVLSRNRHGRRRRRGTGGYIQLGGKDGILGAPMGKVD